METTQYEIRVRYNNGERTRFLAPDFDSAVKTAEALSRLVTTTQVYVNKLTVETLWSWSR